MKLAIITIGDELLLGRVADTNSAVIANAFSHDGWTITEFATVGDNKETISQAITRLLACADLIITTGGLGPTRDDITKNVLMEIFGGELVENKVVAENVEKIFRQRNLELNSLTRAQAMVPSSCKVINNTLGTAPIMWFQRDNKVLVSMPGVPFETRGMLPVVQKEIQNYFKPQKKEIRNEWIVSGISESDLAEKLANFEDKLPHNFKLAYLPKAPFITLRLDSTDCEPKLFEAYAQNLFEIIEPLTIAQGELSVSELVLAVLRKTGYTVGTAESCTGGSIASSITAIAGCSDVFKGSIVAYCNTVKHNILGVSSIDLEKYGAVSQQVVEQMATGACKILGTDCAIATSGIAGPGGAVPGKPVGTVWIAAATPAKTISKIFHFPGDRQAVIARAANQAILMLISALS